MALKVDRFTLFVLAATILLLVAGFVSVLVQDARDPQAETFLEEDSPEAAVYNLFLATAQEKPETARTYFSERVLEESRSSNSYPFRIESYYRGANNQRLRILKVTPDGENRATVRIAIDTFSSGGLFGSGSTWTNTRTVPVVRETDGWKVDSAEFFY